MNWKQPIPTNLEEIFGEDDLCRHIYVELLLHARNKDIVLNFNESIVALRRGQCYTTVRDLSKIFHRDPKTISKALKRLDQTHHQTENDPHNFGTIVTICDYDSVVKMDNEIPNETETERITTGKRWDTNKSVENEERVRDNIVKSSKDGFYPCNAQELYDTALGLKISLDAVVAKHKLILEMVESGEMHDKYPKNKTTYNTLRSWLRGDLAKEFVQPLDEIGMLILRNSNPSNPNIIETEKKKEQLRKEGKL